MEEKFTIKEINQYLVNQPNLIVALNNLSEENLRPEPQSLTEILNYDGDKTPYKDKNGEVIEIGHIIKWGVHVGKVKRIFHKESNEWIYVFNSSVNGEDLGLVPALAQNCVIIKDFQIIDESINDFIEYYDNGDNYKEPERNHANDFIEKRLYCYKKGCKHYIKGVEGYNGMFTAETGQKVDLRNKVWICNVHHHLDNYNPNNH